MRIEFKNLIKRYQEIPCGFCSRSLKASIKVPEEEFIAEAKEQRWGLRLHVASCTHNDPPPQHPIFGEDLSISGMTCGFCRRLCSADCEDLEVITGEQEDDIVPVNYEASVC